jgi:hypothetical protein
MVLNNGLYSLSSHTAMEVDRLMRFKMEKNSIFSIPGKKSKEFGRKIRKLWPFL